MADTETASTFSEEHDELPEYKQLSPLAIIAFVLAVLSVTAIIHPLLWVIPAVGAVLGIVVARKIERSPELTGRGIALFAVVVCVFMLALASSWTVSMHRMLDRQSRVHGEQWLQLVKEGKIKEAHQLTVAFESRLPKGASIEKYYEKKETGQEPVERDDDDEPGMPNPLLLGAATPADELQLFVDSHSMKQFAKADGNFKFKHLKSGNQVRRSAQTIAVEQSYEVKFDAGGPPATLDMRMTRTVALGHAFWQVESVEFASTVARNR